MRFTRLQRLFTALIILCFFVCMILGIVVVSDINTIKRMFGREPVDTESKELVDLSFSHTLTNSSHVRLLHEPDSTYRNNSVVMVSAEKSDDKTSTAVHINGSEDIWPSYDVHIFYYPWYGNPAYDGDYLHWNHQVLPHWKPEISARYPVGKRHQPPDDIASSFYPRLGPYSSRDPSVITDHMRQIRQSGAGVIAVSWYPPRLADNEGNNVDSVIPLLLDAAHKQKLKICFHIEPYKDRNIASLRGNLSYIINRYGNHSAFYRRPGSNLPVYYVYDSYLVPNDHWMALLHRNAGQDSVRGTALDGIFLGLLVDKPDVDRLTRCGFDGFYTYFASDQFTYGSTLSNWASLALRARASGVLFVPSVGPGYDDVQVRPWNAANTRDRKKGLYFERGFSAAVETHPDMISITSFNEWHEGTQIEQAIPKQAATRHYTDYTPAHSDFYLKLTRKWTSIYMQQKVGH